MSDADQPVTLCPRGHVYAAELPACPVCRRQDAEQRRRESGNGHDDEPGRNTLPAGRGAR